MMAGPIGPRSRRRAPGPLGHGAPRSAGLDAPHAPLFAIELPPGLAIAICSATVSLDRNPDLPPPQAIGQIVMIAALGRIIGSARLTGIVTIIGELQPGLEHPSADQIRRSILSHGDMFGRRLWVFEAGVGFGVSVPVQLAEAGRLLPVPEALHDELLAAVRLANTEPPR